MPWRRVDGEALHSQLQRTLLAAAGTFLFGFFGSQYKLGGGGGGAEGIGGGGLGVAGPTSELQLAPNAFFFALSSFCFYYMLMQRSKSA